MIDNNKKILFGRYIHELKSPEINKYQRASMIKEYIVFENLSIRQFANVFNIHRSTVEDWLLPLRVSEDKYNELNSILPKKSVYKILRNHKLEDITELKTCSMKIKQFIVFIKSEAYKEFNHDKDFMDILDELKKAVNYFEFRVENKGYK
jgi:transposase